MEKLYEWPEHIYNTLTKDTFGYTVTPYSIALEGWRRGLELTFHQTKERKSEVPFTLKSSDKSHRFSASRGDKVTRQAVRIDRKSTRLNSSHVSISYAVFCLKKKTKTN